MKSTPLPPIWIGLGVAYAALTYLPLSLAQSQSLCPLEIKERKLAMKIEKLTSITHLLEQLRDDATGHLLCLDPEVLQEGWGITLWGLDWRLAREHIQRKAQTLPSPLPPEWWEERIAKNPVEKYEVSIRHLKSLLPSNDRREKVELMILRNNSDPSQDSYKEVMNLEELQQIFGNPDKDIANYPHPSDLKPPRREGSYPYHDFVWENTNSNYRFIASTSANSKINRITIQMK